MTDNDPHSAQTSTALYAGRPAVRSWLLVLVTVAVMGVVGAVAAAGSQAAVVGYFVLMAAAVVLVVVTALRLRKTERRTATDPERDRPEFAHARAALLDALLVLWVMAATGTVAGAVDLVVQVSAS